MKYRETGESEDILTKCSLVPFHAEYPISEFDCGILDYNHFLTQDAQYYVENNISSVHLLIDNETNAVLGYMALLTDAFLLDLQEKEQVRLNIPFHSVPALKIGKLATSKNRKEYHYGSFLLELALGFANDLNGSGIACRFLTVDADVEFNPDTPTFYEQNGFVRNQHKNYVRRTQAISMRYDLFEVHPLN